MAVDEDHRVGIVDRVAEAVEHLVTAACVEQLAGDGFGNWDECVLDAMGQKACAHHVANALGRNGCTIETVETGRINIEEVKRSVRTREVHHSIAVNRLLGFEHRVAMTNRPDHSPNEASNEVIYAFFEYFLKHRGIDQKTITKEHE